MNKPYARVKYIILNKRPNFWGRVAFRLMRFSGWLFEATGNNSWTDERGKYHGK